MQLFENNEIPEDHIIAKTEYSFIFVNIRPFLPNHILISPKRIVERVCDLTKEENMDLFECVQIATKAMAEICDGYTINIQDGVIAGQKVLHIHVHIVPRRKDDIPYNDEIYKPGNLDVLRTDRSYDEMKEEAEYLRPFFQLYINKKKFQ